MRRRWVSFAVFVLTHATITCALMLVAMGWTMSILDGGGSKVPIGLTLTTSAALLFGLPLLLPMAYGAGAIGYGDPVNDPIYYPLPFINSIAVGCIVFFALPAIRSQFIRTPR